MAEHTRKLSTRLQHGCRDAGTSNSTCAMCGCSSTGRYRLGGGRNKCHCHPSAPRGSGFVGRKLIMRGGHLDSSASQKAKGAFVRESQYNREFVAFLSLRIHLTLSTKPTSTMRKPEVIGAPACSALPECTHASPCRRCTVPSVCAAQCASSCCNRCGRKVPPPWNSLSLHSSTLKLSSEPSRCNSSCRWPPALHCG